MHVMPTQIRRLTAGDAETYHALRMRTLTEHPEVFLITADEEADVEETRARLARTEACDDDVIFGAWDAADLAQRARRASFEWDPFWEYGAFIDVRDLASACIAALSCPIDDHATLLVTAPDITTSGSTSRELAEFVHPGVEWRGGPEYDSDPFRTLLDIEPARRTLGWEPRHTWRAGAID